MKKETFEQQKAFAGEKKPSMQRRCVGHDYTGRQIYMITMTTEGRRPLFGEVVGRSDAPVGDADAPGIRLTELGFRVQEEWWGIPRYYPQITIMALQLMPDHLHGILFVKEQMMVGLSRVIRGFKTGCNRYYRELLPATGQQWQRERDDRKHGLLFAPNYNDRLLRREGQLERWQHYIADNPRRLLMKREHPDLFRVQRGVSVGSYAFDAIGNCFLLQYPQRVQVQCSRSLTDAQRQQRVEECLAEARGGAVMVSPCISQGEKDVMNAVFKAGLPQIVLLENGFTDLDKPGGLCMETCAEGRLLLLAPWEHHNERRTISREQCLALNEMARYICEND